MAKRPSILDKLEAIAPEPAPVAATEAAPARKPKTNDARQHTSVYVPRAAYERLREIAFVERVKIHDLFLEGIDLVIAARGHPERTRPE